jgi:hypothetical protein
MTNKEKLANGIMIYWGYGLEFNPARYEDLNDKEYTAKKERKYEFARAHAEALADIAELIYKGEQSGKA